MYGYTRWHWKAQDYSSCIFLHPLQVGCHIMSRTKQQWGTVDNSSQNKSRWILATCAFIVRWQSNVRPNFLTDCLKGIWAFSIVIEVGRIWRCLVPLEVKSMSFVLLSLSMLAVAQALTSLIHDCIEWSSSDIPSGEQKSVIVCRQQMNGVWWSVSR